MSIAFSDFMHLTRQAGSYDPIRISEDSLSVFPYKMKDFLGYYKEENRKVWQVFEKAAMSFLGKDRLSRICHRFSIDMKRYEELGYPLTKLFLNKMHVAASTIYRSDLCDTPHVQPEWLSPCDLSLKIKKMRLPFEKTEDHPTSYNFLVSTEPYTTNAAYYFDEKLCHSWGHLENLGRRAYLEYLAKNIGAMELSEGQLIPTLGFDGLSDYYVVYRKVAAQGLVAYAIKPLSIFSLLKPMIVFRPTVTLLSAEDAPLTWMNDLEEKIGSLGFHAACAALQDLAFDQDFCANDQKIDILGYSLGGVYAQRFVAKFFPRVQTLYSFNAPSVEKELAEEFANTINQLPSHAPEASFAIEIFRTCDDLVHFVGQKHLGWGITHPMVQRKLIELDLVETMEKGSLPFFSLFTRHFHVFLKDIDAHFIGQQKKEERIDEVLDNTTFSSPGKYWEDVRVSLLGRFVYCFVLNVHRVCHFFHTYFKTSFFRYSS
jgi:hypothetical protein